MRKPRLSSHAVGAEVIDKCPDCNRTSLQTTVEVGLFSTSGYRRIKVWSCDNHPTPENISENKDGTYSGGDE